MHIHLPPASPLEPSLELCPWTVLGDFHPPRIPACPPFPIANSWLRRRCVGLLIEELRSGEGEESVDIGRAVMTTIMMTIKVECKQVLGEAPIWQQVTHAGVGLLRLDALQRIRCLVNTVSSVRAWQR